MLDYYTMESSNEAGFLIEADRQRITQVISNILNNAINFTEEKKGEVNVIVEKVGKSSRQGPRSCC